jgi:homocysteine S-methyltransferase
VFINKSFDAMNLTQPELVEACTRSTCAPAPTSRDQHVRRQPHQARVVRPGRQAAGDQRRGRAIARRARRRSRVRGRLDRPLGIRIEPWGKTGVDEAREYFREQAQALLEGGVDLFILETFRDLNEIGAAIDAVGACPTCRSSRR